MRIATIVALATFGLGPSAFAQSLTAADIQKSLNGKKVTLSCIDGTRGSGRYTMAKNFGTIKGNYEKPDGSSASDTGRVRADGNQLCLTFKILNDGQEQCFGVRSTGQGRFAFTAAAGLVTACQVASL